MTYRTRSPEKKVLGASSIDSVLLLGGYRYELLDEGRYGLFTAANNDGYVTVDYEARLFRTGLSRHGPAHCLASDYTGRGWRKRLETDAQQYLAAILAK